MHGFKNGARMQQGDTKTHHVYSLIGVCVLADIANEILSRR